MKFEFWLNEIDEEKLDQITNMLDKYLILDAREKNPKSWNSADKLQDARGGNKKYVKNRIIAFGLLYLIASLVLFYLYFSLDRALFLLVIAIVSLGLSGVFLFVGLSTRIEKKIQHSAKVILKQRNEIELMGPGAKIIVEEPYITLTQADRRQDFILINYQYALETEDLIGLAAKKDFILLRKEDLIDKTPSEFLNYWSKFKPVYKV